MLLTCFIASLYIRISFQKLVNRGAPKDSDGQMLIGIVVSSLVVLCTSCYIINNYKYEGGLGYGIVLSLVTLLLVGLLIFVESAATHKKVP